MDKKTIHKIKWQTIELEGWSIHPAQMRAQQGFRSLCSGLSLSTFHKKKYGGKYRYWGNGSIKWKNVTCKNCLKMRKQ